jgi:hypothetical protein
MKDVKDLAPIGIMFITAMIALGMGASVLNDIMEDEDSVHTAATYNETLTNKTPSGGDGYYGNYINLSHENIVNATVVVTNHTGETLAAANYSITTGDIVTFGTFNLTYRTYENSSQLNITYNYTTPSMVYNVSEHGVKGMAQYAETSKTLAVVAIAMLIVVTIMGAVYFGRRG